MPRSGTLDVAARSADLPHLSSLDGADVGAARRPVPADQLGGRGRGRARRSRRRRCTRRSRRSPRSSPATTRSRRSGRSRSCRCASSCGPASGRAACASARCATRAAAVEALRDHWGYPVQLGDVERRPAATTRCASPARSTAATVVDVAVHTADVINGSDLMTFDNLHLVRLGDDDGAKLVQIDPEYTIHQADRGRPDGVAARPAGARHARRAAAGVADHRLHVPRRHRPRAGALHDRRRQAGDHQQQAGRLTPVGSLG